MKTPIARVRTSNTLQFFTNLAAAFNYGKQLNAPHKVEAKDVMGVWVCVNTWVPDCTDSQDDTYCGVVNNMWRENVE